MSELLGADTRRVDVIAEGLRAYSQDLQDLRTNAQRAVAEMRSAWGGPDFERIAQRWEHEAGPRLTDVSTALGTMAASLRSQAEAQRQASGNTGGTSVPVGTGGTAGGHSAGGGGGGGGGGPSGDPEPDEIDDIDPDGLDLGLPTVSEKDYADGYKHTEHGQLGPLETMDIETTSGDVTETSGSTFVDGNLVGAEESTQADVAGGGVPDRSTADMVRDNVKLNLAEGDVSADASLASMTGGNENAQYEVAAGKVEAEAGYSVDVDANGNVVASAGASAAAYLGYAAGKVQVGSESLNVGAEGKAYVGAEVKADASASIGPDGGRAHLGGEVFAGGKAEANVGGTALGVTAGAGAEVSYGIGAHANVDAELSTTNVGVSVDIGATLGLGAGVNFDVSVNPQEVIAEVGNVVDDVGDGLADAGDAVGDFLGW